MADRSAWPVCFSPIEEKSCDSSATAENPDAQAVVAEVIDISDHLNLLQSTGNVLAKVHVAAWTEQLRSAR